jgi:hypothetical protein
VVHYHEHPANSQDNIYIQDEDEDQELMKGQTKEGVEIGIEILYKEATQKPLTNEVEVILEEVLIDDHNV